MTEDAVKPIAKIDTLFQRDGKFVVTDELKRPVLGTISHWVATEKIDGTSMRIGWFNNPDLAAEVGGEQNAVGLGEGLYGFVHGKTNAAQVPVALMARCRQILEDGADHAEEKLDEYGLSSLTLYGEGYGAGIQRGGALCAKQDFALFDVRADGAYLSDEHVDGYAIAFNVRRAPHIVDDDHRNGLWSLDELAKLARDGFTSRIAETPGTPAEGIVARPLEPLYDAAGKRLIIKLKTCDWAPASPKPDRRR